MSEFALRKIKVEYAPLAYEMLLFFSKRMNFEYSEHGMAEALDTFAGTKVSEKEIKQASLASQNLLQKFFAFL